MTERIRLEIALLKTRYPNLEYRHEGQWGRIPEYPLPPGWGRSSTELAFAIPIEYPGNPPYGIYAPSGLRFEGQQPNNYSETVPNPPPFGGGSWGIFSWTLDDGCWRPAEDPARGSNLLNWVLGFQHRFREGT